MGTKSKKINEIMNKNIEILKRFFSLSDEKNIKIIIPKNIYARCLKKKMYVLVSSLSEAIRDVDAKEKNNPKQNKSSTNKKIVLLIFLHQL
jgi:hypothetical protein